MAEGISEIKYENNEKFQVAISKLFNEKFQVAISKLFNEKFQVAICKLFNEKLEVNPEITECRRIASKELSSKPRPVMIKLKNDGDRLKCMKSATKLTGTNVCLNEDVCKTT